MFRHYKSCIFSDDIHYLDAAFGILLLELFYLQFVLI